MRTRIKIKEDSNGKVQCICEEDRLPYMIADCYNHREYGLIPILLFAYFLPFKWKIISTRDRFVGNPPTLIESQVGVFDNIEDAKEFIDVYIKDIAEEERLTKEREENDAIEARLMALKKKSEKVIIQKYP